MSWNYGKDIGNFLEALRIIAMVYDKWILVHLDLRYTGLVVCFFFVTLTNFCLFL